MSFSFCTAGADKLQNRWSSRTGQVRQLSRMFSPYGARISFGLSDSSILIVISITGKRDRMHRVNRPSAAKILNVSGR